MLHRSVLALVAVACAVSFATTASPVAADEVVTPAPDGSAWTPLDESQNAVQTEAPAQTRMQVFYITKTDSTTTRVPALKHTLSEVQKWYRKNLGKVPNISGNIEVLRDTAESKRVVNGDDVGDRWVKEGKVPADTIPIIFVDNPKLTGHACGWAEMGDVKAVIIPIGTCGIYPSESASFPHGSTYLTAHEIGHVLGAEHSYKDNRDLLYDGGSRNWSHLRLSKQEKNVMLASPALRK